MNARMSLSELIVAGLAVAVLVAGFASGVIAKPAGMASSGSQPVTSMSAREVQGR